MTIRINQVFEPTQIIQFRFGSKMRRFFKTNSTNRFEGSIQCYTFQQIKQLIVGNQMVARSHGLVLRRVFNLMIRAPHYLIGWNTQTLNLIGWERHLDSITLQTLYSHSSPRFLQNNLIGLQFYFYIFLFVNKQGNEQIEYLFQCFNSAGHSQTTVRL